MLKQPRDILQNPSSMSELYEVTHTKPLNSQKSTSLSSYYFLFILFSDLPLRIGGGGRRGLCVFCLQSLLGLLCDKVVVYKSVTLGSGPEPSDSLSHTLLINTQQQQQQRYNQRIKERRGLRFKYEPLPVIQIMFSDWTCFFGTVQCIKTQDVCHIPHPLSLTDSQIRVKVMV